MTEIKGAICDDEKTALDLVSSALEACFSGHGAVLRLDRYLSPLDLDRRIGTERYQIAFLDIDMPGLDGVELARKLKAAQPGAEVVFVSNREERVFDALRVKPFGFIRKSSFLSDVEAVVALYTEELGKGVSEEDILALDVPKEGLHRFLVPDIMYIECVGPYQFIHVSGESEVYRVRVRMYDFEEKLSGRGFICPYKSFLVNYRYIKSINGFTAELSDGTAVPITKKKKTEFVRDYMRLVRGGTPAAVEAPDPENPRA